MTTTDPRRQLPSHDSAQGWADICEEQVHALFDWANNRLDPYIARHFADFDTHLHARLAPQKVGQDVLHAVSWLDDLLIGRPRPWTPLPSTLRRETFFAREVFDPNALETFLDQTFDHLASALSNRKGRAFAAKRIALAKEHIAPVRAEVYTRLTEGPKLVQALSGPAAYALVPTMWAASSLFVGDRRREREEVLKEMSRRASHLLNTETNYPGFGASHMTRIAATVLLSCIGAAVLPKVTYSLVDVARVYWKHLDTLEQLLLHGDHSLEQSEKAGSEHEFDWDLMIFGSEEEDEKEEEEEEEEEDAPRDGLLAVVLALDTGTPFEDLV